MGWAGVLRDHDDHWISAISGNAHNGCHLHAELTAIEEALKHAWQLGYEDIVCQSNCLEVVKMLIEDANLEEHWYHVIITRIKNM
ncbi:unnamed protein product [Lupinus luteus]|uniref:RNase H type-1 domain-containing protein n=1 Tax=Lupinus luteus TaxID=3873 RepID=A0AAV1VU05_LUPLU